MTEPKFVVGQLRNDALSVKPVTISRHLDWLKWLATEDLVEFFEELLKLVTQISVGKEDSEVLDTFLSDWREAALEEKNHMLFWESVTDSVEQALLDSEEDALSDIAEAEEELDTPWLDIVEVQQEQESTTRSTHMDMDGVIDVTEAERDHYLAQHVLQLEISPRILNCLLIENIQTVRQLVTKEERDVLAYKNFGPVSLLKLKECLANMGLYLGMDLDDPYWEEDEEDME